MKKTRLKDISFDEILNRDEMKEILFGFGSGSSSLPVSGSSSGTAPPISICIATCPCPDGSTYTLTVGCVHDCRAVDNQGVECLGSDGQPKGAVTCNDTNQDVHNIIAPNHYFKGMRNIHTFWIALLLFLVSNSICFSQEIKVLLDQRIGPENGRTIIKGYPSKDITEINGLDTGRFEVWQVYNFSFNSDQAAVERVGLDYLTEIGEKVDTRSIYIGRIPKNNILAFVGIGKDSMIYVAVDANNNRDLTDEDWHSFVKNTDKEKIESEYFRVNCEISYFNGNTLRDTLLPFELNVVRPPKGYNGNPGISDNDSVKKICEVRLMKISYKEGELEYGGKAYRIRITDPTYNLYPFDQEYSLQVEELSSEVKSPAFTYRSGSGSPVRIGSGLFRTPDKIRDRITFTYIGDAPLENGQIGRKLPSSSFTDLTNGKKFTAIEADGDRYLILDLWASWCGPCISALPELQSVSNKFSSEKVRVVSLAVDKPDNMAKIRAIIKEHGLTWPQYYLDSEREGSIFLKEIEIQAFPATFLISPEGVVLYRGVSVKALGEVEKKLESILRE